MKNVIKGFAFATAILFFAACKNEKPAENTAAATTTVYLASPNGAGSNSTSNAAHTTLRDVKPAASTVLAGPQNLLLQTEAAVQSGGVRGNVKKVMSRLLT